MKILQEARNIFAAEPNVLTVHSPMVAIGDIHGQFFDMLHMFEKVVDRRFPNCELLFLGDYVDRGFCSVEVFLFLCCMKIAFPKKVHMLRGNHESRGMTEHFSFRNEVLDKLNDESAYEEFMDTFDALPIAAEIFGEKSGNYLCMHGGISPNMRSRKDIDNINRKSEPPMSGLFCDLLWSDPLEDKNARRKTFTENADRQCSYYYGLEPVKKILASGGYNSILRAH